MTGQQTITVKNTQPGFVVVAKMGSAGWRAIDGSFTRDRIFATLRAASIEQARVLPAMQEEQDVIEEGKRPRTRLVLLIDWEALSLPKPAGERWYAIRTRPGAQVMARQLPEAENDEEQCRLEYRRGESLVERNLREAGIDVYMPAFWREYRTHRGRKFRQRRQPLLVGYAFIRRDPAKGFDAVRDVDGVLDIVANARVPAEFAEADIQFLMVEMFNLHQEYSLQRAHKIEEARFKRKSALYTELGRLLPKKSNRKISLRVHAEACIQHLSPAARERMLGIMSEIDRMVDDPALDEWREAV